MFYLFLKNEKNLLKAQILLALMTMKGIFGSQLVLAKITLAKTKNNRLKNQSIQLHKARYKKNFVPRTETMLHLQPTA